jgi:hypothetical protein
MDLQALRTKLQDMERSGQSPAEAAGLRAFIAHAERLGPGAVIMGKIMMSVLSTAERSALAGAKDLNSIRNAFGRDFDVKVEDV